MNRLCVTLGIVALLGAGCASGYQAGEVPTPDQLAKMSTQEKNDAMAAMATKHPLAPLTEGEKAAEQKIMRQILMQGVPERLADWIGTGTRKATGSARFVRTGTEWALLMDEYFTLEAAPDLVVALRQKGTEISAENVASKKVLVLEPLMSLTGPQAYAIPPGTDMTKYKEAVIYSKAFWMEVATAKVQ